MEKITDINVAEITDVKIALQKAQYCQVAADKIDLMTNTYGNEENFIYFVLEKGNNEKGEDPNLMYLAVRKDPSEPRVSLSPADANAMIMHIRDVYFAGVKEAIIAKRKEIIAKADELDNPA